jgi:uncharacterized short protein YbdD (DUF466 family)
MERATAHAANSARGHADQGMLGRAASSAAAGLQRAASSLGQWLRGATDAQKYENYLRHAKKQGDQPLTEQEFYLDDMRRKYSKPNRCC